MCVQNSRPVRKVVADNKIEMSIAVQIGQRRGVGIPTLAARHDFARQRDFSRVVVAQHRAEDHVRSHLHQPDSTDQRICALAARGRLRPAERLLVGDRVWRLQGESVQRHQEPLPVKRALRLCVRDRRDHLLV